MRAELKKFLFVGSQASYELFFAKAQEWGVIHFTGKSEKGVYSSEKIREGVAALKLLSNRNTAQLPAKDPEAIAKQVVSLHAWAMHLEAELDKMAPEVEKGEPFGEFSFEMLREIESETKCKATFYWSVQGVIDPCNLPNHLIFIRNQKGRDYFFALVQEPLKYPKLHQVDLKDLKEQQSTFAQELFQVQEKIQSFTPYREALEQFLITQINTQAKTEAQNKSMWSEERSFFVVGGWLPHAEEISIRQKLEGLAVQMIAVAPEKDEIPPTHLDNSVVGQMGEDLVNIYDTPSITDSDPSLWVISFFSLFFAFIVGDGGYGLLFLLAALYIRWKKGLSETGLRAWRIIVTVSAACLIWGVLTTSFFGIPISQNSPLRKVSVLQWAVEKKATHHIENRDSVWQGWVNAFPNLKESNDPHAFVVQHEPIYTRLADQVMLELALLIGVIHITISLLRYAMRNPPAIGWLIFLWSATLYLPFYLHVDTLISQLLHLPAAAAHWSLYGMGLGMSLATLLSLIKNKWLGLLEPTVVIQIFGDSMSYLRLYALALAGSMMTGAILELSTRGNFVLGIVVLILGHLANITLSIMGGTIHGLRLNFLEWYHYSFEGGGKPYKPLRLKGG